MGAITTTAAIGLGVGATAGWLATEHGGPGLLESSRVENGHTVVAWRGGLANTAGVAGILALDAALIGGILGGTLDLLRAGEDVRGLGIGMALGASAIVGAMTASTVRSRS